MLCASLRKTDTVVAQGRQQHRVHQQHDRHHQTRRHQRQTGQPMFQIALVQHSGLG